MKKIFAAIAILLLACFTSPSCRAQISPFGSGWSILGVSNSVPLDTNTFNLYPVRQIQGYSVTFTNTSSIITNNVLISLDKTNWIIVGQSIIYSSNGLTFTTNFQAYTTNIPVYTALQACTGTNTETVYAPLYGPPTGNK